MAFRRGVFYAAIPRLGFFRLTPIKINKTAARAAGALLDGDQPLCEQRRHSRVALLPRLYFRRQGAVGFLGGAAARGRRRAAALSVARARARRRRARRVASTGGRRRAHAARSGPMGDGHHRAAVVPSLPPRATAPLCHRRTPPPPPRATPPPPPRRRFRHCASSSSYLWSRARGGAPWKEVLEGHHAVLVVRISIAIRISTLGVTVVVVSVVVFRVVSRARQIWHKGGGSRAGTAPKGAIKARRHR